MGGAIATGLAWGAAFAVGREIWDDIDYFNWGHGDIDVDVDRNMISTATDINRGKKWEHNSYHRRGVNTTTTR